MGNNNQAQDNVHKIQLRSKATIIEVEGVQLKCEYTRAIEQVLTSKFREISELRKSVPELDKTINNIIGYEDMKDVPESTLIEVEALRRKMDDIHQNEINILTEMTNAIFIGNDAQKALDICKDSSGEINVMTLTELINITMDYLTSKIHTNLKNKNAQYKKKGSRR